MKLYLAHSSGYDYEAELYVPLKAALASEHEIFFPHDVDASGVMSKDIIPTCDAILAEVSFASTGQGIELGWADARNIPIICFYRTGTNVSSALQLISKSMSEYSTPEAMVNLLRTEIEKL